jgi:tetratricopeptide (TPR) repeat protein
MTVIQKDQALLFDRDLHRKLVSLERGASAQAWETAAGALNNRAMDGPALEIAEQGLKEHPGHEGLWWEFILAASLYADRLEKAYQSLGKAGCKVPNREVLLSLIDYFLERDPRGLDRIGRVPEGERGSRYYEVLGHYAMARHDHREALALYRKAHRLAPKDLRILYHLAEAHHLIGQGEQAVRWLYRAVHRERHCVRAWNALCRIHLEAGRGDLARQAMGMALSVNPRDWGVYFTVADHYLDRGLTWRARAVLEDILDMDPRAVIAAEVHNYLGYLGYREGRYDEAVPSFEKALTLNPHLSVAWLNLGNLHFHRKDLDAAERCYREALSLDPRQGSAATQLGLVYLEQGQLDLAREPLEKAVSIDPSDTWAHLGLSEFHRRTRNAVDSLDEAREALRLDPKDADVHNYLGIALECNRRYYDAEKAYRRALQLDPMHRWAANNLGYLCEKLSRMEPSYKQAAAEAWKTRLLICRDTRASMRGAINHLKKLGVATATLRRWLTSEPGPGPAGNEGAAATP